MAIDSDGRVKKMHPDDVLSFIRTHEDPVVTAREVAENFDATRRGAYQRLSQLSDEDEIAEKSVGANGKVWYIIG